MRRKRKMILKMAIMKRLPSRRKMKGRKKKKKKKKRRTRTMTMREKVTKIQKRLSCRKMSKLTKKTKSN